MNCNQCGKEIDPSKWKFCPSCGGGLYDEKLLSAFDHFFKSKKTIVAVIVLLLLFVIFFGWKIFATNREIEAKNKELENFAMQQANLGVEWKPEEKIMSLLYMDKGILGKLKIASQIYTNVKVEISVSGITENKSQIISIKPETNEFELRADFSSEGLKKLRNNSETGKISIKVFQEKNNQNKLILQNESEVFFNALNEIVWKKDGVDNTKQVLRLISKDDPKIIELVRNAVKYVKKNGGKEEAMLGNMGDENEIKAEVKSIFEAMQNDYKVRYILDPFSYNGVEIQKIKEPESVLTTQGGICIDLSLVLVAAFENIGLNPVLVFLDNHVWPGIELGYGTGKFVFIEATALTENPQKATDIANNNWKMLQKKDTLIHYNLVRVVEARTDGIVPIRF